MPENAAAVPYRPEIVDFAAEGLTLVEKEEYGNAGGVKLLMDYFQRPDADKPMPAIIWIHGGGFTEEAITRVSRPDFALVKLAQNGYFIASIDYRLGQVAPFPAQIEDCKCAVRYLRANAGTLGIDPEHIGVWGESCGGQLAALMAVKAGIPEFEGSGGWPDTSSAIQAAVAWYGAFDVLKFEHLLADERFLIMYGGTPEEKRELVWDASPIKYVEKELAPILSMCSDSDPRVPDSQGAAFCRRAKAAGNDAEHISVPNQGHGYFKGEAYYEAIFRFFDKHLKGING